MIPALEIRCRSFLRENINAENVLDLLPVVEKMEESELNDVCWNCIDKHARKVLDSAQDSFLEDNDLLVSMLKRDTLDIKEVEIFQVVNRMAESICVKRGITPTGKEKRRIIGEKLLTLIRFPIMPEKEFAEHVTDTKILSDSEVVLMFMYFNLNRKPGKFSYIPRCLNNANVQRCKRSRTNFENLNYDGYQGCCCNDTDFKDSVSLTVNIPIALGGIRLLGSKGREYKVQLKLNGQFIMNERSLTAGEKSWNSALVGYDIIFGRYHLLEPNQPYVFEIFVKGPICEHVAKTVFAKEEVCADNITFKFGRVTKKGRWGVKELISQILFRTLSKKG